MEYNPVVFEKASTRPTPPTTPVVATPTPPTPPASMRVRLTLANPDEHMVLPEIISKEPLGPVVRQGDDQWFNIVKWTLFAMVNCRGTRHHPGQHRRDAERRQPGDPAHARPGRRATIGKASASTMTGSSTSSAKSATTARLRSQHRRGQPAEDRPRPQRAVDRRRPAVRAAARPTLPPGGQ
jgi:hypothetical protein